MYILEEDLKIAFAQEFNQDFIDNFPNSNNSETAEKKYVAGSLPARWRNTKTWRLNDERENILYKSSHINHPSAVWARSNIDHYRYLYDLFVYLIDEYKYRYGGKSHKCESLLGPLFSAPVAIDCDSSWEDPPQAMPEDCKESDTVKAYRNYYMMHKRDFAKWTRRSQPNWWT